MESNRPIDHGQHRFLECRSSSIAGHAQVVAVRNNVENGIPDVPDKSHIVFEEY